LPRCIEAAFRAAAADSIESPQSRSTAVHGCSRRRLLLQISDFHREFSERLLTEADLPAD